MYRAYGSEICFYKFLKLTAMVSPPTPYLNGIDSPFIVVRTLGFSPNGQLKQSFVPSERNIGNRYAQSFSSFHRNGMLWTSLSEK